MKGSTLMPDRRRRRVEINIVPLVDVLVVLIFFFLISMQFRNVTTLQMTLPEIETAGESKVVKQVEIAVMADGRFFYNGERVTDTVLADRLKLVGKTDKKMPILIRADETSLLGKTTYVMDLCRKNGLQELRLQSR